MTHQRYGLLRTLVSLRTIQVSAATKVLAGECVERGDDVPGGTSSGQLIERRELSCQLVRLVERGVDGAGQSEVFGYCRQRCKDREGVRPTDDVLVENLSRTLTKGEAFG
ncbi:MAG: hypothetical protein K0Q61_2363, partial [Rhodococcus erythropolis]|nr:hypothetical protein [Rhodococcus erythropolis]